MKSTTISDGWQTLKGNNQRNSNSLLQGKIATPAVLMEKHIGNYKGYFRLTDDRHAHLRALHAPVALHDRFDEVETRFEFNGMNYLVDGKMIHRHDLANYRLFHLYSPDELNLIYVTESLDLHNSTNSLVVCRVLDEQMRTEILWQVDLPYYHERPHIVIDDMNGDGVPDILVEGWKGMTVYDSRTRQPIMEFPQEMLHKSRKRGYVMTRDLDRDGLPEVVILSCYPWDVNVIDNDGKSLTAKWFKIYDNKIESANIITAYTRTPVCDCDGDGDDEIIFNIWNEQGDGQWHVKILDALTGCEVLDIARAYLHDLVDIDKDGKLELFLSTPAGIDVPEYATISLQHLDGRVLFSAEQSKWGCQYDSFHDDKFALHPGQESRPGLKYVITGELGDTTSFYVYQDTGTRTSMTRHTLAGVDESFQISYPRGNRMELIKSRMDGSLLLSWETKLKEPQGAEVSGIAVEPLCWGIPGQQQIKLPIIARLGGENNSIVVPNGVGQVICFEVSDGALRERWFTDGYGAAEQYKSHMDFGVVADDFVGNGRNQVAVRVNGSGGGIKLVDRNGEKLWQTEFPHIPSGDASGFRGILGFYTSANAQGRKILVVSGQRHVQHTGITYGLDGQTGELLWTHDSIRKGKRGESGAGSFYLTAWDMDGDGVDEVLTGYGNNVWAAKCDTGEILFHNFMYEFWANLWIKDFRGGWVSSISPMPLAREGKTSTFYFGNAGDSHGAAVIDLQADIGLEERCRLIWGNETRTYTDRWHPCEFHYKGEKLIAESAYINGASTIHALDPLTGEEIGLAFRMESSELAVPIACDVDGDGAQEIVFTVGHTLGAISFTGTDWTVVWSMRFPTALSWPVFGDVDGDGWGEIVVTGANGTIYIIGTDLHG